MTQPITVYDGLDQNDIDRMVGVIEGAFQQASVSVDEEAEPDLTGALTPQVPQISPFEELIGIDPEVYRQINAALAGEFRHLMFYGPPGTAKTTIARRVAGAINDQWKLITGSSDWTSQDIIGGYHPLAGGNITFIPGVLLEHFDKPLIFDELNRCDIDKVIGPLFTVLSGQSTTLPYLTDPSDPKSARVEILPKGVPDLPRAYAPSPQWRLIATINSIDKASLYQMSYALTRRFAWIYIDVPADPVEFVREFLARQFDIPKPPPEHPVPLGKIWAMVNRVRPIGPAPVLDIIRLIRSKDSAFNFYAEINTPAGAEPYLDGFCVFLLPMLDGILRDQGDKLTESLISELKLGNDARAERLKARILGSTI